MTTEENGGFDAGKMFDEGVEEAGLDLDAEGVVTDSPEAEDSANVVSQQADEAAAEGTETPAAEAKPADQQKPSAEDVQTAIESTTETEQQVESVIESLLPKPQAAETQQTTDPLRQGKYVPVGDHIKLRERAQAAERKVEELQRQNETSTTQTGGEEPGTEVEKSPLKQFVEDNPEEDFVPAKVQLEEREYQEAKQQKAQAARDQAAQAEREKQETQRRQTQAIETLTTRATNSEAEVRKANPDYDAVTTAMLKASPLTDAEKIELYKAESPAQKLYDICKAKTEALRGVLGQTKTNAPAEKTTTEKAPANEEGGEMSDDEIFDEVKGLLIKDDED